MKLFFSLFFSLFVTVTTVWANGPLTPTRFLNVNGLSVAIYESPGTKGPGILLVHGNTSSANSYAEVFDTAFARQYRLVAVDLPGYGRSQNASSYNTGLLAGAIASVAQQTGTDHGVVVGWSLGGDLTLQASTQLPHVKGYMIFGTAPLGAAPNLPSPFLTPQESYAGAAVNYGANPGLTPAQIDAYVTAFFRPGYSPIPAFFFADGQRTDPGTRGAVFAAVTGQDPTFQDEVAIVKNLQVPIAILLGKKDAFIRPEYLTGLAPQIPNLWRQRIDFVANTGHAIHWERASVFTATLRQFVRDL